MKHLYLSRYVFLTTTEKGIPLLYNSKNRSFAQLPADVYEQLEARRDRELSEYDFPEDVRKYFTESGVFVTREDDEDYVNYELFNFYTDSYASDTLCVSLAPTLDCNFACPYCYEKHKRKVSMGEEDIERFLRFVRNYPKKRLYLHWYGGEPLLAFETMKKIADGLNAIEGVTWAGQGIVTNGYLIDDEVIDFFKRTKLETMQISLDGNREHHDSKRFDKLTREGSFDTLVDHIGRVLAELPETRLNVRINVDKTNAAEYKEVAALLQNRYKEHARHLYVYPGLIRVADQERRCWGCESMVGRELYDFYKTLYDEGVANVEWMPLQRSKGCTATGLHSFVIGPTGDIYKCWNDLGDASRCCGNIGEAQMSRPALLRRYMIDGAGINSAECRACALLPVCHTGCPWERVENKFNGMRYDPCLLLKDGELLKKSLSLHYDKRTRV